VLTKIGNAVPAAIELGAGGRGAVTALVLAACFAAVATDVSLTRQFDLCAPAGRSISPARPSPPTRPVRRHDRQLIQ
jgi:hypothetical protein